MRMARVNVYLPDALYEEAKGLGLPVSELTQSAIRQALDQRGRLAALQQFLNDLTETQGPATDAEIAEADTWAASVVAAAIEPKVSRRRKRAAS
jgi:hypothetical protein